MSFYLIFQNFHHLGGQMKSDETEMACTTMVGSWGWEFFFKCKRKGRMGVVEECYGYWWRASSCHVYCEHGIQ
jgi:hypothetical protein